MVIISTSLIKQQLTKEKQMSKDLTQEQKDKRNARKRELRLQKSIEKAKQEVAYLKARIAFRQDPKSKPSKLLTAGIVRKERVMAATPKWLSFDQLQEMENFKIAARKFSEQYGEQHHVDHIVPLRGENVSGLNVPWNLQILTAQENVRKSNKF
jgi:hypothetical protein